MAWLALDQGGHASRALVFDGDGRILAAASEPVRTLHPDDGPGAGTGPGRVEHDPEELVGSLRRAVDRACGELPADVRLRGAGLATQRSTLACWRLSDGTALAPVISWQDRRNEAWLRQLEPRAAWIRERTGLVLTPHYGASKMRWCLDHLPDVADAAAKRNLAMGPLASFLLHRLLVERPLLTDPANGARTQLLDIHTRDWSEELCRLFGIDPALLPRPVTSRYPYGTLPTPRGPVPLLACTGDQSAVPFAFGDLDPATAYLNTGTGAFVQRALRDRLPEAPRLLVSVVWSEADTVDYLLEGTVNGAGSALDWLAGELDTALQPLLARLDAAAEEDGPGTGEPPLFLNGVAGLGSPWWRADFTSRFEGQGDPLRKLAAVLESIAFLTQVNLEELAPFGPPFRRILLTGGFSANDYFQRCLASLTGLPVDQSTEPEATARGLARRLAGPEGDGWHTAVVPVTGPPVPGIRDRYRRWRRLMESAGESDWESA
jgi:glycerol kinase